MDIALVTHNVRPGDGQGVVNRELVRHLTARGHQVTLYAHAVDAETASWAGVHWRRVPAVTRLGNLLKGLTFTAAVSILLLGRRHQVIHVNGGVYPGRHSVNTVHYCHSGRTTQTATWYQRLYTAVNAWFERQALRRAQQVVAISNLIAQEVLQAGVAPERLTVIPNGVDPHRFNPEGTSSDRAQLLAQLGTGADTFVLLFVGDLATPRKGLGTLLEALAQVPELPVQLVVAGNLRHNRFAAQAAALGDRVKFVGLRADVERLYRAADVFVFPTRYEPSGLVILEAMACGTPVITSAQAGMADLVTSGQNSWLLSDPTNAAALAAALRYVYTHPAECTAVGQAAQLSAQSHTWAAMAARYERLYAAAGLTPAAATLEKVSL